MHVFAFIYIYTQIGYIYIHTCIYIGCDYSFRKDKYKIAVCHSEVVSSSFHWTFRPNDFIKEL